jgi:SAM-dependent methyltransferase
MKGHLVRLNRSLSVFKSRSANAFRAEDFKNRESFRGDYSIVAKALVTILEFDSVLDIGCGNGFLLAPLDRLQKKVMGIEVAEEALALLPEPLRRKVQVADATKAGSLGSFDLVACVEVVEHILPTKTERLLDAIANNSAKWIYFTAASPYQPGHGHINMRPQFFYLDAFRKRGFRLEYDKTTALTTCLEVLPTAKWLYYNSLIFKKKG